MSAASKTSSAGDKTVPKSRALFFPYIRLPDSAWVRKVLLYWDEIAAIIPGDLADDSDAFDPFTRDLLATGLVRRRRPEVHAVGLSGFETNFLKVVDQEALGHAGEPGEPWLDVHLSKLGHSLLDALGERGLATREPKMRHGDVWVEMEPQTAMLLSAYLAVLMRDDRNGRFDPVTYSDQALAAFGRIRGKESEHYRSAVRMELIQQVLPVPSPGVGLESLSEFKQEFGAQLVRFRSRLERDARRAVAHPDDAAVADEVDYMAEELDEEKLQIFEAMERRAWKPGLATLALLAPAADALPEDGIGPVSALAGVGVVAAACYTLSEYLGERRARAQLMDRPLAYAALAERRLARP